MPSPSVPPLRNQVANLDLEVSPYLPSNKLPSACREANNSNPCSRCHLLPCGLARNTTVSPWSLTNRSLTLTPSNLTPGPSSHGENHPQDRGIVCGYQLLLPRVLSSKDASSTSPELKCISHILNSLRRASPISRVAWRAWNRLFVRYS